MNGTPLYPYFPRTKSGPNLFASDPKPEQERPAHVNLGRQRLANENWKKRLSPSLISRCQLNAWLGSAIEPFCHPVPRERPTTMR